MARRQKYKFAKKEYAKKGRISTWIAAASAIIFLIAVIVSYAFQGQAGVYVGGLGLMAMLLSVFGFGGGVRGFSEKKCSHIFCTVGTIANGLMTIIFLALISLGVA